MTSQSVCDMYVRKKENDLTLGPKFEDEAIINLFLTLQENQALGREVEEPTKFDDIVIRVRNGENFEYYYRQLKHKDTEKNNKHQAITWNDLFSSDKKNSFNLREYFNSYLSFSQKNNQVVKELSVVTTIGFTSANVCVNAQSNLIQIAQNINTSKRPSGPKPVHPISKTTNYVTQDDLNTYFTELPSVGVGNIFSTTGKRYKFSKQGIEEVAQILGSPKFIEEYKEFLRLLMFETDQPHANELKKTNDSILKQYFPFYLDLKSHEKCDQIKLQMLEFLKPVQGDLAKWATVEERRSLFKDLTLKLKKEAVLGSKKHYEVEVLSELFKDLMLCELKPKEDHSQRACPGNRHISIPVKISTKTDPLRILNIYNDEANSTVIALKVFGNYFGSPQQEKTLFVEVSSPEAIENILNHFEELPAETTNVLLTETFVFVVQVSPFFRPVEDMNVQVGELVKRLSKLNGLRKWIQFTIITKHKIDSQPDDDLYHERDSSVHWDNLPDPTKKQLFRKQLLVQNKKETNLEILGFDEEFMNSSEFLDPTSLAELIIHDERQPLSIGLPTFDDILASIYIDRKLRIPVIDIKKMNEIFEHRVVFDKNVFKQKISNDSETTYHLVMPVNNLDEPPTHHCWRESSDQRAFQELQSCIIRSQNSNYLVPETDILEDNCCFGNGSEGIKLVIVVDLPGKGKSCLLTSLTNQFVKKEASKDKLTRILFRVNLLECSRATWEKGNVMKDRSTAVDFFVDHMVGLGASPQCSSLSSWIIKKMFLNEKHPSVFLFFDGFDEISDKQRDISGKMINLLIGAKGIQRIVLTSRPDNGLEDKLESYFRIFPFHLTNFNERDQIDYLTKRWNASIQEYFGSFKSSRLTKKNRKKLEKLQNNANIHIVMKSFAETLVKYTQKALKNEDKTFLDIPLQCMIVAECFFEELKRYLNRYNPNNAPSEDCSLQFDDNSFELLRLYERFYETKINIMFREKANLNDYANVTSRLVKHELSRNLTKAMQRLSIFHMMKNVEDAEVLCRLKWFSYRNLSYAQDLELVMKLGMIHGLDVHQPFTNLETPHVMFIHRTFAEYFFSKFLIRNFAATESKLLDSEFLDLDVVNKTFKIIKEKVFIDTEYAGIRRFFDRMLANHAPPAARGCPLASNDWKSQFNEMSQRNILKPVQSDQHANSTKESCSITSTNNTIKFSGSGLYAGFRRFFRGNRPVNDSLVTLSNGNNCSVSEERKKVLSAWPCIGHEKFNNFLVEIATLGNSAVFQRWSEIKSADEKTFEELVRRDLFVMGPTGADFAFENGLPMPSLTMVLIHCIKEYASRPGVSKEQRQTLSKSITLITIKVFETPHRNSTSKQKTSSACSAWSALVQWFDPAIGLSNEENSIFSEWFFKMLNYLIQKFTELRSRKKSTEEDRYRLHLLEALSLTFSLAINHHRNFSIFDHEIRALYQFICSSKSEKSILSEFYNMESVEDLGIRYEHVKLQSKYFLGLFTFGQPTSSDAFLLDYQLDWFHKQLKNLPDKKRLLKNKPVVNPFAFTDAAEFLYKSFRHQDNLKAELLLEACMEFTYNTLSLHASFVEVALAEIKKIVKRPNESVDRRFEKNPAREKHFLTIMGGVAYISWHVTLADRLIVHLPDNHRQAPSLKLFFCGIGRILLIYFAEVECCCKKLIKDSDQDFLCFMALLHATKPLKKEINRWFKDKLKQLWGERGEIAFIDFLLREEQLPPSFPNKINQRDLTCVLFSRLVSSFIPNRLTEEGRKYFRTTLLQRAHDEGQETLNEIIMQKNSTIHRSEGKHYDNENILSFLSMDINQLDNHQP